MNIEPDRSFRIGAALAALFFCTLAAPAPARPAEVTVTRQDCQRLLRHIPQADVAYRPGVDVNGRAVAPADLDGGVALALPDSYSFDIEIQPIAFAERRRIAARLAEVLDDLSDLAAEGRDLAGDAADLAAREAGLLADFGTATAAIVAATGGAAPSLAQLAARDSRLETLRNAVLGGADFLALQGDLARNRQAGALNRAAASALESLRAALAAADARIAGRGLDGTTMTVGRVEIDVATGRASFNGQPLQSGAQAELAAACQQVLRSD